MTDQSPQEQDSGSEPDREQTTRADEAEQEEPSREEAADDQDAGPTATPEQVEQDPERDQAEG